MKTVYRNEKHLKLSAKKKLKYFATARSKLKDVQEFITKDIKLYLAEMGARGSVVG
jgi:hypothetical protein